MSLKNLTLILAGPTASGKSALAFEIAQKIRGVILNGDSLQLYRDLPLLTAQPSLEDYQTVPHSLYGILDKAEISSAAWWATQAAAVIQHCYEYEQVPIIVGGTGFYLKALLEGLSPIPAIPAEIRQEAQKFYEKLGITEFKQQVASIDPLWVQSLQGDDRQRLLRAWEVFHATGETLTQWQQKPRKTFVQKTRFLIFCLNPPRSALVERAYQRFDQMLEQGALEEVRKLWQQELPLTLPIFRALGALPLIHHLQGSLSLSEACFQAKADTRAYIKRQQTWFQTQLKTSHKIEHFYCEEASRYVQSVLKEVDLSCMPNFKLV